MPSLQAYGTWVESIPVVVDSWLEKIDCAKWLSGLINDGIISGVGAVLVGTGCGVPGVMASRTIVENKRDRRMTIMTACFASCGAKMPIIALFAGALFGGSTWVAILAYFVGAAAIMISGVIWKKTKCLPASRRGISVGKAQPLR